MLKLKRLGAWCGVAALFMIFLGSLAVLPAWILPISNAGTNLVGRAEEPTASAAEAAISELMDNAGIVDARGYKAPDFELDMLTGGKVSLGGLKGRVVHLTFWASW